MRLVSLCVLVAALAGCAFSPPKPPKCEGEFRPLNIQRQGASTLNGNASLALCEGGSHVHG